ncbi:MAG: hypothetical protein HYU64_04720 [Armatimonadetes bacterium]|nr:hypothetical protein [Armatimonadota bacterium]
MQEETGLDRFLRRQELFRVFTMRIYLSQDVVESLEELLELIQEVRNLLPSASIGKTLYLSQDAGGRRVYDFDDTGFQEFLSELSRGESFGFSMVLEDGGLTGLLRPREQGFHWVSLHLPETALSQESTRLPLSFLDVGKHFWRIGGGVYGYAHLVTQFRRIGKWQPGDSNPDQVEVAKMLSYLLWEMSFAGIPTYVLPPQDRGFEAVCDRRVAGAFWANLLGPGHLEDLELKEEQVAKCQALPLDHGGLLLTVSQNPYPKERKALLETYAGLRKCFSELLYLP